MSPIPHKKKPKKKLKTHDTKTSLLVPPDRKDVDFDWWRVFWHKNSSTLGASKLLGVDVDEEEGFKHFFRVSKSTFEYICSLVKEDLISRPPSGLINIEGRLLSVEKQVSIAMRRLASGESQVSVGTSFGVGQSTVSQVTWRFIEAMEERAKHHLKWPDVSKMDEIKSSFEASYGLPNCCGSIDTTHIIMTLPAVQASDDWCDQRKNSSMLLQAVVDHEMRFLDIVTGLPGAMTVSRLLKCSGLYRLCEEGERLNGSIRSSLAGGVDTIREYIVGGVGYPLLPWLITPNQGSLSDSLCGFNDAHEAARSVAVKALLRLKGSWRILSKVMWRPDKQKLPSIILVCCLLHNIIIDRRDELHPDVALSGHHDSVYGEESCSEEDDILRSKMRENLGKELQHMKNKARLSS